MPSACCVATNVELSASASVADNWNVRLTGTANVVPSGCKRYPKPIPFGMVLVMGWMLTVVAVLSAPAGMMRVMRPSAEVTLPPVASIT